MCERAGPDCNITSPHQEKSATVRPPASAPKGSHGATARRAVALRAKAGRRTFDDVDMRCYEFGRVEVLRCSECGRIVTMRSA
jgi:hypothetical protein